MYLTLIATSGNQNFIFATNKLRENVGASELTYRSGTTWILDAVETIKNNQNSKLELFDSKYLRKYLLNPLSNPAIEDSQTQIEVIVASSGKVLLITKDKQTAKQIIQKVTHTALKEAPGIEICGVFEEFDWNKDNLGDINRKVNKKLEQVRSRKPSANFRFLRLPVVDECKTSGLPASKLADLSPTEQAPTSCVSLAKRKAESQADKRLTSLIHKSNRGKKEKFAKDVGEINSDWLAVIHADGNGLGEIFLKFHEHIQATSPAENRNYIQKLRKFSIALDICTEKAFLNALQNFPQQQETSILPLVPLILGGDDLTVVCEGRSALKFTQRFLEEFEKQTAKPHKYVGRIIAKVAKEALGLPHLSACAGVAIIKPHFPFSIAYELAEGLMKSAKQVKEIVQNPNKPEQPYPCSSLDFHVLYDSSGVDFDSIRKKLQLADDEAKIYLYRRPYVVSKKIQGTTNDDWIKFHQWDELLRRVKNLVAEDPDGRRQLPNSQMHGLRSALFLGRQAADGRYKLIRDRYLEQGIIELAGDRESLFQKEPLPTTIHSTMLLDVIEIAEFLEPKETSQ